MLMPEIPIDAIFVLMLAISIMVIVAIAVKNDRIKTPLICVIGLAAEIFALVRYVVGNWHI